MDGIGYKGPGVMAHGGAAMRRTLAAAIGCVGTGLHSGRPVTLTFRPAPSGDGIVFRRTDLGLDIPARWDLVCDTRLCTVLSHPEDHTAIVGTVEHVMAALAACGVDDAVVEVDGPEMPALDGSSAPFVFLLDCAGLVDQDLPAAVIEVLRPVQVSDGDAWAELRPNPQVGLDLSMSIAFDAAAIGRQAYTMRLDADAFRHEISAARTFGLVEDIERMRAAGLGLGGSLDNAVIVDGDTVLNPGGLRMSDEFVRHKMLDAVGDLAMAGAALRARFTGHRSGHRLNNKLLHALFADSANWRWADAAMAWQPVAVAA